MFVELIVSYFTVSLVTVPLALPSRESLPNAPKDEASSLHPEYG